MIELTIKSKTKEQRTECDFFIGVAGRLDEHALLKGLRTFRCGTCNPLLTAVAAGHLVAGLAKAYANEEGKGALLLFRQAFEETYCDNLNNGEDQNEI